MAIFAPNAERKQQQRVKNAKLWKPGEDVANYYDVEALQKQFNDIAAEDAGENAPLTDSAPSADDTENESYECVEEDEYLYWIPLACNDLKQFGTL